MSKTAKFLRTLTKHIEETLVFPGDLVVLFDKYIPRFMTPAEALKSIGYQVEKKTARILKVWQDDVRDMNMALYELSEPVEYKDDDENGEPAKTTRHVLVSAIEFYPGPETHVFPCDEEGRIRDHLEIRGSYRGGTSHKEALAGLGYELEVE